MQHAYDATIKDMTITVLFDSDADVSFSDYDDPTVRLLSSENKDEKPLRRP